MEGEPDLRWVGWAEDDTPLQKMSGPVEVDTWAMVALRLIMESSPRSTDA
jgi:hypothetical protein